MSTIGMTTCWICSSQLHHVQNLQATYTDEKKASVEIIYYIVMYQFIEDM